jgi:hypothetical protein
MKKRTFLHKLLEKWILWMEGIRSSHLVFPVNNVEEKCIPNTTKGFMARRDCTLEENKELFVI